MHLRKIATIVLIVAIACTMVVAVRTIFNLSTPRHDTHNFHIPTSERLAKIVLEAGQPFASTETTPVTLLGLRDLIVSEARKSVTASQANALADAFLTRLLVLMQGDYSAFAARVRAEGYILPPEIASSSERNFNTFILQSRSWRIDHDQVELVVNSGSTKPGESEMRMSVRASSGVELLPEFSAEAQAGSDFATVRIGVLSNADVPSYIGYQFRWNQRAGVWVATSPSTASKLLPGELSPPLPTPAFPLF